MKKCSLLLLAAIVMISGCDKIEQSGSLYSRAKGEKVVFGSLNPHADLQTKASYTGDMTGNVERINWEIGDVIAIFCSQIDNNDPFKYKVNAFTSSGSVSTATLSPVYPARVMEWGDNGTYTFFASSLGLSETLIDQTGTARFTLPSVQTGTRDTDNGDIIYKVNPNYMLMTAKTVVEKTSPDPAEAVNLSFLFLPTALEISLSGSSEGTAADAGVTIKEIELSSSSDGACLSGTFDADISSQNSSSSPVVFPTITSVPVVANPSVKMSFGGESGETVPAGKKLTFTYMMCPSADLTKLTLKITILDDGIPTIKKAALSDHGTHITLSKHKKTRLIGVMVPAGIQWTLITDPSIDYWNGGPAVDVPVSPETEIGFSTFITPWINDSETGVSLEREQENGFGTSFNPWTDGSSTGVTLEQNS